MCVGHSTTATRTLYTPLFMVSSPATVHPLGDDTLEQTRKLYRSASELCSRCDSNGAQPVVFFGPPWSVCLRRELYNGRMPSRRKPALMSQTAVYQMARILSSKFRASEDAAIPPKLSAYVPQFPVRGAYRLGRTPKVGGASGVFSP